MLIGKIITRDSSEQNFNIHTFCKKNIILSLAKFAKQEVEDRFVKILSTPVPSYLFCRSAYLFETFFSTDGR